MSASAKIKLDRAAAMGWTRSLPAWCGPCRFLRVKRRERRRLLAVAIAAQAVDNRWRGVIIAEHGEEVLS